MAKAARSNIGMATNSTEAASLAEQLQFDVNDTQTRLRSTSSDSSLSTDWEPRDVTPPSQGALYKKRESVASFINPTVSMTMLNASHRWSVCDMSLRTARRKSLQEMFRHQSKGAVQDPWQLWAHNLRSWHSSRKACVINVAGTQQ